MKSLVEELNDILNEFNEIENPTQEQINEFKQREFDLFDDIVTIRELCEYYKTDMEIDKLPKAFISGMYSGVVNGSMFVIKEILDVINKNESCTPNEIFNLLKTRLDEIQGLTESELE